jgi:hypothetical protein
VRGIFFVSMVCANQHFPHSFSTAALAALGIFLLGAYAMDSKNTKYSASKEESFHFLSSELLEKNLVSKIEIFDEEVHSPVFTLFSSLFLSFSFTPFLSLRLSQYSENFAPSIKMWAHTSPCPSRLRIYI